MTLGARPRRCSPWTMERAPPRPPRTTHRRTCWSKMWRTAAMPPDLPQPVTAAPSVHASGSRRQAPFWVEAAGTVHYDKVDINVQLQALAIGQTLTDTFTYAIQLGNGTLSWASVTLQFNGANDSVFITSSPQSGSVVEDANATPDLSDSQS